MHIKFINPKGSPSAAVSYVCRAPKNGEKIDVLRGNPATTSQLAEALDFKHKYTSAVIAWHPDDNPSDKQISEAIDRFEALAFAGLSPEQYNMLAVQHEEKDGSKHVHIIVPRVDLANDKSMNIAPPGSHKTFDAVRDFLNEKHGWKSPDISLNPENARTTHLGLNRGSRADLLKSIDDYVVASIEVGDITNRASLVEALEMQGLKVTKQSKNFITILDENDPQMKKGMRLKGAIYAKDFSSKEWLTSSDSEAKRESKNDAKPSLDELSQTLDAAMQKRIKYNEVRHPSAQPPSHNQTQIHTPTGGHFDDSLSNQLRSNRDPSFSDNPPQNQDRNTTGLLHSNRPTPSPRTRLRANRFSSNSGRLSDAEARELARKILALVEKIMNSIFGTNSTNFAKQKNAPRSTENDRSRSQFTRTFATAKSTNEAVNHHLQQRSNSIDETGFDSSKIKRNADEIVRNSNAAALEMHKINQRLGEELRREQEAKEQQEMEQQSSGFEYNFK